MRFDERNPGLLQIERGIAIAARRWSEARAKIGEKLLFRGFLLQELSRIIADSIKSTTATG